MLSFSGRFARLYWLGEPIRVQSVPLEDCGDGFDWRVADENLRFWPREDDLVFEMFTANGWRHEKPLEVHAWSGRVGFARSLAGPVRLHGQVCPLTLAVKANEWDLTVDHAVESGGELGGSDTPSQVRTGATAVTLSGCDRDPGYVDGRMLACLVTAAGAFFGLGDSHDNGSTIRVALNGEGVHHEPL